MRRFENEKRTFKGRYKKMAKFLKKKGKCYNYGKEDYFAREYRSFKTNYAKTDNFKEKRKRRT